MSLARSFFMVCMSLGLVNIALHVMYMKRDNKTNNISGTLERLLVHTVKRLYMDTESSRWLTVIPDELYVYSAYLDDRAADSAPVVKVIAASSGDAYRCYCRIWHLWKNTKTVLSIIPGVFVKLPDTGGRIRGYYISCSLTDVLMKTLTHVDIIMSTNTTANFGWIKVQKPQGGTKKNFTMCLSPLYGQVTALDFVEYIEVNRLLGADHFMVYIMPKSAEHLIPVLTSYQAKGLLTLLDWNLPLLPKGKSDIFYFAQTIALTDCLYRTIYTSHFMINTDMDEFIVPQEHHNWRDMIESLDNNSYVSVSNTGSYSFRNIFFSTAATIDSVFANSTRLQGQHLKTLDFTLHEAKAFPHRARSKYICRPHCVRVAAIHYAFSSMPKCSTVVVDTTVGVLHHYRKSPKRRSNQTNKIMHRFAKTLMEKMISSALNISRII